MIKQTCYNGVRLLDQPSTTNIRRLDLGVMPMVAAMQANGILIDKDHFHKFSRYLKEEEERLTEDVRRLTNYRINLGSPDQIAALLFDRLKLKPMHIKKVASKRRYIVDDEALESIKHQHLCIPKIQEFTEVHKLRTSYTDVLPVIASQDDGRVRTTLRVTRQVPGRISSSEPNLMAQPVRTDLGKRIRDGYIAPPGRKLGTIDLSQIEMRTAADDADCFPMIDTFLRDGDIHAETASRIFHLPVDKLDKMKHRYPAKRIGFGILFGITEEGLRDQILVASDKSWTEADRQAYVDSWPLIKCAEAINSWFGVYSEIRPAMNEQYSRARQYGYTWDYAGRIRWIPEVKSVHKRIVEAGLRYAYSHRIQSTAQTVMKLAMAEIWDTIVSGLPIMPLLQIHDELLVEGYERSIEESLVQCQEIVANCVRFATPIKSSYAYGDRWGKLEK